MQRPSAEAAIVGLLSLLILSGLALIFYAEPMSAFSDQGAATDLFHAAYSGGECPPEGWYDDRQALRTSRNDLMNFGSSLVVIGGSLMILLGWLSSNPISNLPILRTPSKKAHFFVVGVLLTIATCLGIIVGLDLDSGRGMFAPCADSIGIMIFGLLAALPISLGILIVAGIGCAIFFGKLPVSLWIWDYEKPAKSWLVSLVFGGLVALLIFLAAVTMWSSDFLIIGPSIVAIYLTLATRAAILAPK